jgi:hypothetical protein
MFIYNVHSPTKTFALAAKGRSRERTTCVLTPHTDNEDCAALIERVLAKARLSSEDTAAVRDKQDGAGIVYEFDADRWSLEDGECMH